MDEFSLVLLLAGGIMIIGSVRVIRRRSLAVKRLQRQGLRASGVVIRYRSKTNREGYTSRYPVVQFQAPDGRLITAETDYPLSASEQSPAVGEQVDVLYDPTKPDARAHLDTGASDSFNRAQVTFSWVLLALAVTTVVTVLIVNFLP